MQRQPELSAPEDWPIPILVWLGKAGISPVQAAERGAGWAAGIERFILPCSVDGQPTGAFTGRSLDKDRPKYVAGGSGLATWIDGSSGMVVFVEDILSAWRVAAAGFRACAVLGTSFPQDVLDAALCGRADAVSWLDPDKAGRAAHVKLRSALSLWDVQLKRVQSERDPKMHSREEIIKYVGEAT